MGTSDERHGGVGICLRHDAIEDEVFKEVAAHIVGYYRVCARTDHGWECVLPARAGGIIYVCDGR